VKESLRFQPDFLESQTDFEFLTANYKAENFSSAEESLLRPFFSNLDRPVFVVTGLPVSVGGALIARHSMAESSMRRTFLDDYLGDDRALLVYLEGQKALKALLASGKAEALLRKNMVERGHDSLGATMPVILGFEGISQLAAKAIEDTRLGLGPIERSTRYGDLARKKGGKYPYARPPEIMNSNQAKLYERAIDASFDLYRQLQEPVAEAYRQKFPEASAWVIKRMTFDATRVLLVAGVLTNLGAMVNAQALEKMIIKLKANRLQECREIGQMILEEAAKISPVLVERPKGEFGQKAIEYRACQKRAAEELAEVYLSEIIPEKPQKGPLLVDYELEGEEKVIARILWPSCQLSSPQVMKAVRNLSDQKKRRIIEEYLGQRPDRRSKPGRPFEEAELSFQIICCFGEWRDLQRNRILTPYWRRLDFSQGFEVGEDLKEFGFEEAVKERLENLAEAHSVMAAKHPIEAQYLVAFGTLMPYLITLNFRELVHLTELRTGPGAHPAYAKIASAMARQAAEVYPLLAAAFQFVNWH